MITAIRASDVLGVPLGKMSPKRGTIRQISEQLEQLLIGYHSKSIQPESNIQLFLGGMSTH